jgi:hypothetical protein
MLRVLQTRASLPRTLSLSLFACVALLPLPASAQEKASRDKAELERIGADAAAFRKSVPNFSCKESVSSEEWRQDKLKWRVTFSTILRVTRGKDGALAESIEMKELEGKPILPNTKFKFKLPIFVEGGFRQSFSGYFAPDAQSCYRYTLSEGRIDFEAVGDVAQRDKCENETGLRGFAIFDASGKITHVERRIPVKVAEKGKLAPFAAVDFAPTELHGRIYRLPSTMISERPHGKSTLKYAATYTGCELYTSTVKILPESTQVVSEPQEDPK